MDDLECSYFEQFEEQKREDRLSYLEMLTHDAPYEIIQGVRYQVAVPLRSPVEDIIEEDDCDDPEQLIYSK